MKPQLCEAYQWPADHPGLNVEIDEPNPLELESNSSLESGLVGFIRIPEIDRRLHLKGQHAHRSDMVK